MYTSKWGKTQNWESFDLKCGYNPREVWNSLQYCPCKTYYWVALVRLKLGHLFLGALNNWLCRILSCVDLSRTVDWKLRQEFGECDPFRKKFRFWPPNLLACQKDRFSLSQESPAAKIWNGWFVHACIDDVNAEEKKHLLKISICATLTILTLSHLVKVLKCGRSRLQLNCKNAPLKKMKKINDLVLFAHASSSKQHVFVLQKTARNCAKVHIARAARLDFTCSTNNCRWRRWCSQIIPRAMQARSHRNEITTGTEMFGK